MDPPFQYTEYTNPADRVRCSNSKTAYNTQISTTTNQFSQANLFSDFMKANSYQYAGNVDLAYWHHPRCPLL